MPRGFAEEPHECLRMLKLGDGACVPMAIWKQLADCIIPGLDL